jgi:flagellar biogenesis protein FliO
MNKNKILIGVGILALIGVGYVVYRKIRTSSDSPEKNTRKIRVIGKRNVTPEVDEDIDGGTIENEI